MLRQQSWPLIASGASLALAALLVLGQLPALLTAVAGPGPSDREPHDAIARILLEHETDAELDERRFNGRSFFFKPPPPPPVRREAPPRRVEPAPRPEPKVEEPKGPPPPPAEYKGPAPQGIMGNVVWFESDDPFEPLWIAVGEEVGGVKVLAINSPWEITLGWQRGEYPVRLFDFPLDYSARFTSGGDDTDGLAAISRTGNRDSSSDDAGEDDDRTSRTARRPERGRPTARPDRNQRGAGGRHDSRPMRTAGRTSGTIDRKPRGRTNTKEPPHRVDPRDDDTPRPPE